jgi:fucose permease
MYGNGAVLAAAISGSFVFGLTLALLGGLKLSLARHLRLGPRRAGGLFAAFNLALIPLMLLGGVLLDRWGERVLLLGGPVAVALGLMTIGSRPGEGRGFAGVLLAALGAALLGTAATVLAPKAFFGPGEAAAAVALASVFAALGALLAPAATDLVGGPWGLRRTLLLLAMICLVPAFPAALAPPGALDVSRHQADFADLVGHGRVWLAALVFFFYVPLEAAVALWTTPFLADPGTDPRRAGWALSGFWTTFLVSRAALAAAQHAGVVPPRWDGAVLVLPGLLAAVVLGNVSGSADRRAARPGLLLLGLLLGPVYPTLVGLVLQDFPREPGTALGLVYAAGSFGALLWSPLVGAGAGRTLRSALRLPMLLALALMASSLVFVLTTR